ncbi:MAG: amidohydrolase family protein [Promethearchaeota archaeon]
MLKVKIETESGIMYKNIIVIDSHSHLGKDVDGAEMMNPMAPGRGTFDFWSQIQGLIEQEWSDKGGKQIETQINGKDHILTFDFEQLPFTHKIFSQLKHLQSQSYKDLLKKSILQQFIDQAVVFPFQDVFRDKKSEALYRASNINISRFTTRFPFSLRLIGYMRCDPMEGEKAVKEVDYCATQLGVRGLKLHPRSEGWIDNINSQKAVNVMVEAAKYSLPIIFDTRGKQSILEIGELIKSTRNHLKNIAPGLIPHLKVIIAHFAQGNVGDYNVYRTICQPNTWGDLSMLHGKGASIFFKDFRQWFNSNNMQHIADGRKWSQFLLFATDFPYFGPQHAKGLIYELINKEFFDGGGTLEDAENILGMNQLKLLPEYNLKLIEKNSVPALSSIISTLTPDINSLDIAIKTVARLIDSGIIDINKILFQFDGSFSNYKGEVLINAKTKQKQKQKQNQNVNLVLMNLIQDKLTMISTLSQNSIWKKFGYKYFNPEDREFFHSILAKSQPTTDEKEAFELIKRVF